MLRRELIGAMIAPFLAAGCAVLAKKVSAVCNFVLVHGGWHGGWCWADVLADPKAGRFHELKMGHNAMVTAPAAVAAIVMS